MNSLGKVMHNTKLHWKKLYHLVRLNRSQATHVTLPHQPSLLMLRQLSRDTVHHTSIVEDDQIALLPPMCVYSLRSISSALQRPTYPPHLVQVGDGCHLPCGRISRAQRLNTAAGDLEMRSSCLEVAPDHRERMDFLGFEGWQFVFCLLVAG
jgi:hypothetical protein